MTVAASDLPPEGMLLDGVALAGDPAQGAAPTEGLSLLFTEAGIGVRGPQPDTERLLPWAAIDTGSCREQTNLPDGRIAMVMTLTAGAQQVRFLLPADNVSPGQAAYLDQALPAWIARYKAPSPGSARPPASPAPSPPAQAPPTPAQAPSPPAQAPPTPAQAPPTPAQPSPPAQTPPTPAQAPSPPPPPGVVAGAPSPPLVGTAAPGAAPGPGDGASFPGELQPFIDPRTGGAVWPDPLAGGSDAGVAGLGTGADDADAKEGAAAHRRRTLVLLVVLLVVVAAGGYLLAKHYENSTTSVTPAAVSPTTTVSPAVSLAESVNLHLTDLPSGWATGTGTGVFPTPAEKLAASQAMAPLATCLGLPLDQIDGVFAGVSAPDQQADVASPVFVGPSGSHLQMSSRTTVLDTPAEATAAEAAFQKPDFLSCYTTFQTKVIAAAGVSGASAQVTPVTLPPVAGVQSYSYVTTFTVPGRSGTTMQGDAYLFAGRVVAVLQPVAIGTSIPSSTVAPPYDAMTKRLAADAGG